jgi:hypothetical protein
MVMSIAMANVTDDYGYANGGGGGAAAAGE